MTPLPAEPPKNQPPLKMTSGHGPLVGQGGGRSGEQRQREQRGADGG